MKSVPSDRGIRPRIDETHKGSMFYPGCSDRHAQRRSCVRSGGGDDGVTRETGRVWCGSTRGGMHGQRLGASPSGAVPISPGLPSPVGNAGGSRRTHPVLHYGVTSDRYGNTAVPVTHAGTARERHTAQHSSLPNGIACSPHCKKIASRSARTQDAERA